MCDGQSFLLQTPKLWCVLWTRLISVYPFQSSVAAPVPDESDIQTAQIESDYIFVGVLLIRLSLCMSFAAYEKRAYIRQVIWLWVIK